MNGSQTTITTYPDGHRTNLGYPSSGKEDQNKDSQYFNQYITNKIPSGRYPHLEVVPREKLGVSFMCVMFRSHAILEATYGS